MSFALICEFNGDNAPIYYGLLSIKVEVFKVSMSLNGMKSGHWDGKDSSRDTI